MTDNKPAEEVDVTKEWRATQGQKSAATRLRLFAALSWIVAIGGEIAGVVLLRQHKFDHGNLPLLIGILVGIAIFAIAGSLMWKAANKHDPARESDKSRFFFQNQLGAIITLIAFLPLIVLIFMDKDMDPKNKKIAGGVGAVLAVVATLIGVELQPAVGRAIHPGHEHVRGPDQGQAADHGLFTRGRRPGAGHRQGLHHGGRGDEGRRHTRPVRMSCTGSLRRTEPRSLRRRMSSTSAQGVSPLSGKTVNHGSVTEAYAENATRITKQIAMEQKQCGFTSPK